MRKNTRNILVFYDRNQWIPEIIFTENYYRRPASRTVKVIIIFYRTVKVIFTELTELTESYADPARTLGAW